MMFPDYKNVLKSMNMTNAELNDFIREHNNGRLPYVGGGINEEIGSDHYGYEIVAVSTDNVVVGYREINGCNSVFWAILCTDKRQKKNYGKYVPAVTKPLNVYYDKLVQVKGVKNLWISDDLRPTELDPSF